MRARGVWLLPGGMLRATPARVGVASRSSLVGMTIPMVVVCVTGVSIILIVIPASDV